MKEVTHPNRTLFTIKVLHTFIWAFYVLIIIYFLYAAATGKTGILLCVALALIGLEGIILLVNEGRCPLTILAEKYTDQTEVGFDIFLPKWLAKNNKLIFTPLCCAGLILVLYRFLVV